MTEQQLVEQTDLYTEIFTHPDDLHFCLVKTGPNYGVLIMRGMDGGHRTLRQPEVTLGSVNEALDVVRGILDVALTDVCESERADQSSPRVLDRECVELILKNLAAKLSFYTY